MTTPRVPPVVAAPRPGDDELSPWDLATKVAHMLPHDVEEPSERALVLDRVYADFLRRVRAGEAVDVAAFCEDHPEFQSSLRRMLDAHDFLNENDSLLPSGQPRTWHERDQVEKRVDWPAPGTTWLQFSLLQELGRGAFAHVYLAQERRLGDRLVVVKVAEEALQEAKTLGKLEHANIVPVYSVQRDHARKLTALCMPYLGAATLADVKQRCHAPGHGSVCGATILAAARDALPAGIPGIVEPPDPFLVRATYIEGVAHLAAQLADALAYAHAKSIFHRDLKPSNVLIGPGGRPRLLDFNLSAGNDTTRYPFGGTVPYMSPEQLRIAAEDPQAPTELDARSDLFSLGVILYELLTGAHPFGPIAWGMPGDKLGPIHLERLLKGPPPAPLRAKCPAADARLERLVTRCLSLERERRPSAAVEVAAELRATLAPLARLRRRAAAYRRVALALVPFLAVGVIGGTALQLSLPANHLHVSEQGVALPQRSYDRGLQAYQARDYQNAVVFFSEALDGGHDRAQAYFARGRAFQQQERYHLALLDYEKAEPLLNHDGRFLACLGFCRSHAPFHGLAVETYARAIEAGYETAAVRNNEGYSYLRMELHAKAQDALDRALQLDPQAQAAYHNRAVLHFERALLTPGASFLPAIHDIQQALAAGPATGDLYLDAARCCVKEMELKETALGYLEQALALGKPARFLNDVSFAPLHEEPRFKALLTAQEAPTSSGPVKAVRLVDPVASIPLLRARP